MSGPAKQPVHLRVLRGTYSGPLPDTPATSGLPPLDSLPSAPAWLKDPVARGEWRRLGTVLVGARLLNSGNVTLLEQACATYGNLARIWSRGAPANAALTMSYRALLNSLGLLAWNPPPGPRPGNRFGNNAKGARIP